MTTIHITRSHGLEMEDARARVEKIAQSLRDDIQADYYWNDNNLLFKRSGASGTIRVTEDSIDLDIELGIALAFLAGPIEDGINRRLDAALR